MTMRNSNWMWMMSVGLLAIAGCGYDSRLADGGGGNLLTAGSKVVGGQMTEMTQDELQVLSDQLLTIALTTSPELADSPFNAPLSNDQADALLDFLKANSLPGQGGAGLNSIEEVIAFAEAARSDPRILVVTQSLVDAFAYLGESDVNVDESILFEIFGIGFENLQSQFGQGNS